MGEYAKFKNEEIKIGTCESMYYLRYEDRDKVTPIHGSLDPSVEENLLWRLPFLDEDKLGPGQYESHDRGLRLYKKDFNGSTDSIGFTKDFTCKDLEPGTMQMTHKSGLILSVPCHHGEKLPDLGEVTSYGRTNPIAGWNGKTWSYELSSIKNTPNKVVPIVGCRHCGHKWSFEWEDIWDFIPEDMKKRLRRYTIKAVQVPEDAPGLNLVT